jgi:hypothetical protein
MVSKRSLRRTSRKSRRFSRGPFGNRRSTSQKATNLAHLAEKPEEAYQSWSRYLNLLNQRRNQCAIPPLIARIQADAWSNAAYEEAVQTITRECQASVSAFSEIPFEKAGQNEIEPRLYNPLFEEGKDESPFIRIAEPLAQQKRTYVVTSEAQHPVVMGVPRVVRANLFSCGLPERDAWDLSNQSEQNERIVKIDWFRTATQRNRYRSGHPDLEAFGRYCRTCDGRSSHLRHWDIGGGMN